MGAYSPARKTSGTTVTTVGTKLLNRNPSRTIAVLVNDSTNVVYLNFGPNPTMNSGIRLNASGGTLVIERQDKLESEVWAIAAADSNVTVTEY